MIREGDRAWCPDCRARQLVEEVSSESYLARQGEVGYSAVHLACGHQLERGGAVIGQAPGAPYAPGAYPTRAAAGR